MAIKRTWSRAMLAAVRRCLRAPHEVPAPILQLRDTATRGLSTADNSENWNDFNNVAMELRNISREQGLDGAMPETKLLKELGYRSLVHAIRKKHGGVASVAAKLGLEVDKQALEDGKRLQARNKRRDKRNVRLAQHDFY